MKFLKIYLILIVIVISLVNVEAAQEDSSSILKVNSINQQIHNQNTKFPFDIIIPFILSLIVALISVYTAHYLSVMKRRKNLVKTYKFVVKQLISASNDQSENFNKMIEILEEEKTYTNHPLDVNCNFSLNSLNKLPLDLIIEKIILDDSKSELFADFLKQLNILDVISNRYLKNHDVMIDKFNQYLKDWNYNIGKIREIFDNYRQYLQSQGVYARGNDPFFDALDLIFYNYSNLPNYLDYYISIEHLIKPIRQLCKDNSDNRLVLPLLNHILGCEGAFINYVEAKKVYIRIYSGYRDKIIEASDFLHNNLDDVFS